MKNAQPHATTPATFWAQAEEGPVHPTLRTPCWIWTGFAVRGYGRVRFKGKIWRTHRLAFFLRTRRLPPVVQHACDVPSCINPDHLRAGTHVSNQADKVAKRRQAVGMRVHTAKLGYDSAHAIRAVHATGAVSQRTLARWFGVDKDTIRAVVKHETWRPLHPDATEPPHGDVPF